MENISDIKKGDKVYFGRGFGEKTLGEVIKVNRVKVKVRQLESRGTYKSHPVGTVWTVPVSLLTKADAGSVASAPRVMPVEVQNRLRDNQDRDFAFMRGNEAPKPKRPDADILAEILSIYCNLSPENLHCDGEISRSAAARKGAALNRRLRECFVELGRRVSEGEAFGYGR
jgi:hypothetical protein